MNGEFVQGAPIAAWMTSVVNFNWGTLGIKSQSIGR